MAVVQDLIRKYHEHIVQDLIRKHQEHNQISELITVNFDDTAMNIF